MLLTKVQVELTRTNGNIIRIRKTYLNAEKYSDWNNLYVCFRLKFWTVKNTSRRHLIVMKLSFTFVLVDYVGCVKRFLKSSRAQFFKLKQTVKLYMTSWKPVWCLAGTRLVFVLCELPMWLKKNFTDAKALDFYWKT